MFGAIARAFDRQRLTCDVRESRMPEPKKFDAVTIIGIGLAMAIIWYGYSNMQKRAEAEHRRMQELRAQEMVPKPPVIPGNGTANVPAPKPESEDPPIAAAPNIVVSGEFVELEFSNTGGTLVRATLPGIDEDPAKKDKKGLLLLTEIEKGKRAFGIPHFYFDGGDASLEFDAVKGTSLDARTWAVKDSGAGTQPRTIEYSIALKKLTITKTFVFNAKDRFVRCNVSIKNETGKEGSVSYWLNGPQGVMPDVPPIDPKVGAQQVNIQAELAGRETGPTAYSNDAPDVIQIYASSAGEPDEKGRSISRPENLWGAVKNRFHMATLISMEPRQLLKILISKTQNLEAEDKRLAEVNIAVTGYRSSVKIADKATQQDPYALYLGPADDSHVEIAEAELKPPTRYYLREAIQFCDIFNWRWPRVDWLARQIMWVFQGVHRIFGSFGIALLLTTMLIKLVLHPLQRKTMVSMSKMQGLQPDMDKIKAKYKDQKSWESQQKMQMEIRDLMQKHGASPVSGCLPMLIQIPVLSALYGIFSHAFDMRGATFLWIKDLSQPDHLAPLPFWPHWLNALPILYIILSYFQTRMAAASMKKSDDPQQEMQRKMMMFMPVMIGVMWYTFMPAGLMLYFVISALWAWGESIYIKKFVLHNPDAPVPQPTGI